MLGRRTRGKAQDRENGGSTFTLALFCKLLQGSGGWYGWELFGVSEQSTPLVFIYTLSQQKQERRSRAAVQKPMQHRVFQSSLEGGLSVSSGLYSVAHPGACSLTQELARCALLLELDATCYFIPFSRQKSLFCKLTKAEVSISLKILF